MTDSAAVAELCEVGVVPVEIKGRSDSAAMEGCFLNRDLITAAANCAVLRALGEGFSLDKLAVVHAVLANDGRFVRADALPDMTAGDTPGALSLRFKRVTDFMLRDNAIAGALSKGGSSGGGYFVLDRAALGEACQRSSPIDELNAKREYERLLIEDVKARHAPKAYANLILLAIDDPVEDLDLTLAAGIVNGCKPFMEVYGAGVELRIESDMPERGKQAKPTTHMDVPIETRRIIRQHAIEASSRNVRASEELSHSGAAVSSSVWSYVERGRQLPNLMGCSLGDLLKIRSELVDPESEHDDKHQDGQSEQSARRRQVGHMISNIMVFWKLEERVVTGKGRTGAGKFLEKLGKLPEFRKSGSCNGVDAELFFPERGASTKDAKDACRRCSVREECLQYALDNGEKFGIWGGLSERERRRIRRQRKLAAKVVSETVSDDEEATTAA